MHLIPFFSIFLKIVLQDLTNPILLNAIKGNNNFNIKFRILEREVVT